MRALTAPPMLREAPRSFDSPNPLARRASASRSPPFAASYKPMISSMRAGGLATRSTPPGWGTRQTRRPPAATPAARVPEGPRTDPARAGTRRRPGALLH
ncbi:hypothetical protein PG996_015020 [Apiospora saccharicola]|uniref:Uncharacterized protein n=1 Tax=Apiospora saccharicola TaxID=335842 RepID=A0ABR1TM31_9PEZI